MKLLTAEVIRNLKKYPIGSQEGLGNNARVLVKYFGGSAFTYLVTEAEPLPNGDWRLFGKATLGSGWEWGYTLLSEIEALRFPPFGLPAERDLYLSPNARVCEEAR